MKDLFSVFSLLEIAQNFLDHLFHRFIGNVGLQQGKDFVKGKFFPQQVCGQADKGNDIGIGGFELQVEEHLFDFDVVKPHAVQGLLDFILAKGLLLSFYGRAVWTSYLVEVSAFFEYGRNREAVLFCQDVDFLSGKPSVPGFNKADNAFVLGRQAAVTKFCHNSRVRPRGYNTAKGATLSSGE